MKIPTVHNQKDRRKILYWLGGMLSVLMFWKFLPSGKKNEKPVKMLTEDGRLVEVDVKHLGGQRTKLKPDEFHSWVKRKK
jgi:hypothetical protein